LAWGMWIGFDWLRIGASGGLLWVRWWTFGFLRHGVGRTPLDEWSARRKGLYLQRTTYKHKDKHPCPERYSNPRSQQSSGQDLRLRPRGHRDRLLAGLPLQMYKSLLILFKVEAEWNLNELLCIWGELWTVYRHVWNVIFRDYNPA
jgi:hypothetical protein